MKNNFSRMISLIIIVVLSISIISSPAMASDNSGALSADYVLLNDLGILPQSFIDLTGSNLQVSRSVFAQLMCSVLGYEAYAESLSTQQNVFSDVSSTDKAYGSIMAVNKLGLMQGDGKGKFNPNNQMDFAQVLKVVMVALGYGDLAPYYGGYPTGYITLALNNDILDGIQNYGANIKVKASDVITIIYNAINCRVLEYTAIGDDTITISDENNQTLINVYHRIYAYTGVVKGVAGMSVIDGDPVEKDRIYIDDKLYKTSGNIDFSSYFGKKVDYYMNSDEVVLAVSDGNHTNRIISISGDDVEVLSDTSVKYFDGKTDKIIKLNTDTDIVYNGRLYKEQLSKNILNSSSIVQIIDTGADGKYDILTVMTTQNYVVERYDPNTKTVYDMYSKSRKLVIEDEDECIFVNDFGDAMSFNMLQKYDVISVVQSMDKSSTTIYYSNKETEGELVEISSDSKHFVIDGKEYRVADNFLSEAKQMYIGQSGLWVLDCFGQIAAYKEYGDSYKYGYLIAVAEKSGLDTTYSARLMTDEGKVCVYQIAENVIIDGKNTDFRAYYTRYGSHTISDRVVRYYISNDKLKSIDTTDVGEGNTHDKLCTIFEGYNADKEPQTELYWNGTTNVLGARLAITSDTKVFVVPDTVTSDDEAYQMASTSVFIHETQYPVNVYADEDGAAVADVAVRYSSESFVATDYYHAKAAVVKNLTKVLDDDGDPVYKLEAILEGRNVMYYVRDNSIVEATKGYGVNAEPFGKLVPGDVVKLTVDGIAKEIIDMVVLYKYDEDTIANGGVNILEDERNFCRLVKANVYESSDGFLRLTQNDLKSGVIPAYADTELVNANNYIICKCKTERGKLVVERCTVDDITDYVRGGNAYSKIVMWSMYTNAGVIVVYE